MSPDFVTATRTTDPRYAALEDRILARDQKGASDVYYDLVREGRPMTEMIREAVRIHAPYTHVPYHERIDDGYVNFVNNDHCLLTARAAPPADPDGAGGLRRTAAGADDLVHPDRARHLEPEDPEGARALRARPRCRTARRPRRSCWPDQAAAGARRPAAGAARPLDDAGASRQGARRLPRVPRPDAEPGRAQRGAGAARLRRPDRRAGPRLLQPLLHDRPQGLPRPRHGRARRLARLGQRARRGLCRRARHRRRPALVLDLRDGLQRREGLSRKADGVGDPVRRLARGSARSSPTTGSRCRAKRPRRCSTRPASASRSRGICAAHAAPLAGKSPRRSSTQSRSAARSFSKPRTSSTSPCRSTASSTCNTLGWFCDNFEHPHHVKLLYLVAVLPQPGRLAPEGIGDLEPRAHRDADDRGLDRREQISTGSRPRCWRSTGPRRSAGRRPISTAAPTRSRWCSAWRWPARGWATIRTTRRSACMLEDFGKNRSADRDRLLLAAAHHTAVHRKYGNPLDCAAASARRWASHARPDRRAAMIEPKAGESRLLARCCRAHRSRGRRGHAHLRHQTVAAPMPNLENLRKQAKLYLRWHRDGYHPVAAQIRADAAALQRPQRPRDLAVSSRARNWSPGSPDSRAGRRSRQECKP